MLVAFILALALSIFEVESPIPVKIREGGTLREFPLPLSSLYSPICPAQHADKRRQKPIFVMMHVGNEEGEVRVRGNKGRKGGE